MHSPLRTFSEHCQHLALLSLLTWVEATQTWTAPHAALLLQDCRFPSLKSQSLRKTLPLQLTASDSSLPMVSRDSMPTHLLGQLNLPRATTTFGFLPSLPLCLSLQAGRGNCLLIIHADVNDLHRTAFALASRFIRVAAVVAFTMALLEPFDSSPHSPVLNLLCPLHGCGRVQGVLAKARSRQHLKRAIPLQLGQLLERLVSPFELQLFSLQSATINPLLYLTMYESSRLRFLDDMPGSWCG